MDGGTEKKDRQTDRQTGSVTKTYEWADILTDKWMKFYTDRTDRHTDRQTNRHSD